MSTTTGQPMIAVHEAIPDPLHRNVIAGALSSRPTAVTNLCVHGRHDVYLLIPEMPSWWGLEAHTVTTDDERQVTLTFGPVNFESPSEFVDPMVRVTDVVAPTEPVEAVTKRLLAEVCTVLTS